MNARLDPFKDVRRLEKELKRSELYEDILKQLKTESYDASPIGHNFVSQYEQQLPGIITAVSGDHSFLNSDEESNRRVIMEAVSGGMALKAGLVAAVLMIIYKIIRVMTNNPSFKGGAGGGRGSTPYVAQKQEELVTAAENLKNAMQEAKDSIAIVKGNAATRDETSPQYEAAEKAASAYRVYTQIGNGAVTEENPQQTQEDPLKIISDMDLAAFGFGNLPGFMMLTKREQFQEMFAAMDAIFKVLKQYSPGRLADMVEQVSVKLSRPQDSAFLLTPAYNNMISELVTKVGSALGLQGVDPNSLTKLSIDPELKKNYDLMIRTSYGELMEQKDEDVIPLQNFILDYVNSKGEFAERSAIVAEFNSSFSEFIGDNKELEDSSYYSNLQHYVTKLTEYKQEIKQEPNLANKDELIKRIDLLISIIETYTKFLLAMLCMFRKEADKVDTFREANIDKMNKLAKALTDFANATRAETT